MKEKGAEPFRARPFFPQFTPELADRMELLTVAVPRVLCQREAELVRCAALESSLDLNRGRTLRLQSARCRC